VRRTIALAVCALASLSTFGTASASGTGVCSLVTKKEAAKILGAKVVSATSKRPAAKSAQECVYKTKKFTAKRLRKLNAPLELVVVWGPVTQQLRDEIATNKDLQMITGLGDAAYATADSVFAIRGEDAVQATVFNWETKLATLRAEAEQAVRLAVPRLPTG
jgi:hypothetical protein